MESSTHDHHIQVGVGVVIIQDGKTLLAKRKGSHSDGMYGSMGGHVEFGESPVEAAMREAREELGIEIDNIEFATCTNLRKGAKQYIDISFTARIASGEPHVCEPDRVESMGWYALDELPEPLFEPVAIVLESLKTGQRYFESHE